VQSIGHWSLMSPADNTSALQAVISWLFRVTGAPHLAVGPSLLRALWHGMRCQTMSEIRRWDVTHFNVSSRHFCSRSTSFPSALVVFHDYALYKFTIDIDIDIGCPFLYVLILTQLTLFYRATLRKVRYYHAKSSVCPFVRL